MAQSLFVLEHSQYISVSFKCEPVITARALLDTGSLKFSFVTGHLRTKLVNRGWTSTPCHHEGLDGSNNIWRATSSVQGRLIADRSANDEPPIEMELTLLVLEDLPVDVIIGAEDVRRFQLADLLKVLVEYDAPSAQPIELPLATEEPFDGSFPEVFPTEPTAVGTPTVQGSSTFQTQLEQVLDEFTLVFQDQVGPSPADVPALFITVMEAAANMHTKCRAPRPQPAQHLKELRNQLTQLEELGIIKKCSTPFFSQVVLVVKKDGSLRFCVDYRRLNVITIPEHWPLPDVKSLLRGLAGKKYFAVIDLTAGYHQCPMDEESAKLTAFITPDGIYYFTRVPFGLRNAPAYFQRMIATVLEGLIGDICHAYIDDIIIAAEDEATLLVNIKKVLQRLQDKGLRVKISKCQFGLRKVDYLGFVVDGNSIEIDPKKLQALQTMRKPLTISELRGFIGFVNYFRDHVPNLASALAPLTRLTGNPKEKKKPVEWTDELEDAYQAVKDLSLAAYKLMHLKDEGELILQTDASDFGLGGALLQRVGDQLFPIIFVSKTFTAAQSRWTTTDKEMFAVVYSIRKLHHFLANRRFVVRSDHRSLSFDTKPSASAKVERWKLSLQEYDFQVEHISGAENVLADTLSRLLVLTTNDNEQTKDTEIMCPLSPRPDSAAIGDILSRFHGPGFGHPGIRKTQYLLRNAGYGWPNINKDVQEFVSKCITCQEIKSNNKKPRATHFHVAVTSPDDTIQIDHVGPLAPDPSGNTYILIIVDCFSRFLELGPTKSTDALEVVEALVAYCCRYGTPRVIHSDRGPAFKSTLYKELTRRLGASFTNNAADSHQENAIVERFAGTVRRALESFVRDPGIDGEWSSYLPLIMRMCNGTIHCTTGQTPATLRFGYNVLTTHLINPDQQQLQQTTGSREERLEQLIKHQAQAMDSARLNQLRNLGMEITAPEEVTQFVPGSWVWRFNFQKGKTDVSEPRFKGPYEVMSQDGNRVTVRTAKGNMELVLHVQHLKQYKGVKNPRALALEGSDLFPVDEILGHTNRPGKSVETKHTKLRVQWGDEDRSITDVPLSDKSLRQTAAFVRYASTIPELKSYIPKNIRLPESIPDPNNP